MGRDLRKHLVVRSDVLRLEGDKDDSLNTVAVPVQKVADRLACHMSSLQAWVTIDSSADAGECKSLDATHDGQFQRFLVATSEKMLALLRVSTVVHRADSVDDTLGREIVPPRDPSLTSGTAAEAFALIKEAFASGAVDGAVDTAAAKKGFVRRVDNGVELEFSDVAAGEADAGVCGCRGVGKRPGRRAEREGFIKLSDRGDLGERRGTRRGSHGTDWRCFGLERVGLVVCVRFGENVPEMRYCVGKSEAGGACGVPFPIRSRWQIP